MGAQRLIIQVVPDWPVERVGLHREQVRPVRCFGQRRGPLRVSGIGEARAAQLHPQRQRRRAAGVLDFPSAHGRRAQPGGLPTVPSSVTSTGNRRCARLEPGNSVSIASASRARMPGGPATCSGVDLRENWPSRIRKGSPPKWSPCKWVTATASTAPGSSPWALSATRLVAPQSTSSTCPPPDTWIHVSYPPPLPDAPRCHEMDPHSGILTHPAGDRTGTPRSMSATCREHLVVSRPAGEGFHRGSGRDGGRRTRPTAGTSARPLAHQGLRHRRSPGNPGIPGSPRCAGARRAGRSAPDHPRQPSRPGPWHPAARRVDLHDTMYPYLAARPRDAPGNRAAPVARKQPSPTRAPLT